MRPASSLAATRTAGAGPGGLSPSTGITAAAACEPGSRADEDEEGERASHDRHPSAQDAVAGAILPGH